jgi:glycine cleavage system H protein
MKQQNAPNPPPPDNVTQQQAASDVYSPISGEVVEINGALADEPAKINGEPHSGGWMIKVKMSDKGEMDALMAPADYEKHIQ